MAFTQRQLLALLSIHHWNLPAIHAALHKDGISTPLRTHEDQVEIDRLYQRDGQCLLTTIRAEYKELTGEDAPCEPYAAVKALRALTLKKETIASVSFKLEDGNLRIDGLTFNSIAIARIREFLDV